MQYCVEGGHHAGKGGRARNRTGVVGLGSTLLISIAFALISPLITLFGAGFCRGMWVYCR